MPTKHVSFNTIIILPLYAFGDLIHKYIHTQRNTITLVNVSSIEKSDKTKGLKQLK